MIHFVYLIMFAFFVSIAFGALSSGTARERIIYGLKSFLEFVVISLILAWILYFIPW